MAGYITQPDPGSRHSQQSRHPLEVVDRRLDHQPKLRADQANASDYLAVHLHETGKDMLDSSPVAGDASV